MLKLDKEYVLRQIGDDYIIVPVGEAVLNFNGMLTVNETGAFLWEELVKGTNKGELLRTLMDNYEVTQEEAEKDIDEFLEFLQIRLSSSEHRKLFLLKRSIRNMTAACIIQQCSSVSTKPTIPPSTV